MFALAGREWDLLAGVFAPVHSPTTAVALELLGLPPAPAPDPDSGPVFPVDGTFLEIGAGTGVIAVSAALAGCTTVVATDISAQAVRNTAMNAERHGVADRLVPRHGDLFDAVGDGERFDTVYWHSNYVLAPDGYEYGADHERAYVDPGYRAHRRYLAEAPGLLTEGGTALLQFSERGDLGLLRRLAEECGRTLRPVRRCHLREGEETIELVLYEVCIKN
ncbi:50S ribosomal protein L11 methyltransferase [Streptomyces lushanensis]|uniref:50S ribosomal protein L11 methyltransferase n=1 Tax=Streptomyces lushanensis TaxID=1434255 RepID=UPI001FDEADFF|nr:50S ribosomal protein L11 methyltransferase [Streptomyces lushanensis]